MEYCCEKMSKLCALEINLNIYFDSDANAIVFESYVYLYINYCPFCGKELGE